MANPKYVKQYNEMLKKYKNDFELLKKLSSNKKSDEFLQLQKKILRTIRIYEDSLCAKSEKAKYNAFTPNLADKFMSLIRADYPEIDLC